MFWENFILLCNKKGESPNSIAKKIGISSGTITNWKNGVQPRPSAVKKLSEYFGVTVEQLLAGEEPKVESVKKESTHENMDAEFADLYPHLTEEEKNIIKAQMEFMLSKRGKK